MEVAVKKGSFLPHCVKPRRSSSNIAFLRDGFETNYRHEKCQFTLEATLEQFRLLAENLDENSRGIGDSLSSK